MASLTGFTSNNVEIELRASIFSIGSPLAVLTPWR